LEGAEDQNKRAFSIYFVKIITGRIFPLLL